MTQIQVYLQSLYIQTPPKVVNFRELWYLVFHSTLGLMEKKIIPHTQKVNIVSITKFTSEVSC